MTVVFSDKMQAPYNKFMVDTIERLSKYKVKGLAISALCENGETVTGYWHMSLQDKATVHTNIMYDCIDDMLLINKDRYLGEDDQNDDETDD